MAKERSQWIEDLSRIYRADRENKNFARLIEEAIKRGPRNFDGSRICREDREHRKILDGSIYCRGSVEVIKRSLERKDFCRGCVEKLLSFKKRNFSRKEKHRDMNATSKLSTKHPNDILSS